MPDKVNLQDLNDDPNVPENVKKYLNKKYGNPSPTGPDDKTATA